MKIGIFTLPFRFGYGGILQAYALQTVLKEFGNEVSVVQIQQGHYTSPKGVKALAIYTKRILFRILGLSKITVFEEKRLNREWPLITSQVHQFVREYIHLREIKSFSELSEHDYDALVVGSDQVWRPAYCDVNKFFLSFAKNWKIKRIAYAASFGSAEREYGDELIDNLKPLAEKFNAISVREDSGVELCKDYFGIEAHFVLDPTLLLSREKYELLIRNKGFDDNKGNLFVYVLDEDENKKKSVNIISDSLNLHPYSIKVCGDQRELPLDARIQPSVETWLKSIADSNFVVTDSFHGCVFSIIFHKPFVIIANAERGQSRLESLLRLFHLENRLLSDEKNLNILIRQEIDWLVVDKELKNLQKKSIDYISFALHEETFI